MSLDIPFHRTRYTKTENPKYAQQGLEFRAPFPKKSYFVPVMGKLLSCRRLFIPKSREMLTSWEVMGYAAWLMAWCSGSQVIAQADKEDKAWSLVNYVRILLRNSPDWMQQHWSGMVRGADLGGHVVLGNGSEIIGIPSGENQIRHYHPTLYIMDEAAKLPEAQACYDVAHPVAQQIVAVSTVAPGWFWTMVSEQ